MGRVIYPQNVSKEADMKIQNYRQVKGKEEVPGVTMHIVAGPDEGAPNFVMRVRPHFIPTHGNMKFLLAQGKAWSKGSRQKHN